MSKSIYDIIMETAMEITKVELSKVRRYGTDEELEDAVRRMEEAGGYENLADE